MQRSTKYSPTASTSFSLVYQFVDRSVEVRAKTSIEERAMDFFVYAALGAHIYFLTLLAISAMLAAITVSSRWGGWT
jgi:hypothetical protein